MLDLQPNATPLVVKKRNLKKCRITFGTTSALNSCPFEQNYYFIELLCGERTNLKGAAKSPQSCKKKFLFFVPSAKYPYWLFEVKRVLMFYWPELDSLEWNCQISTVKAVSQFGIRAWQLTPIKVENSNCSPQQSMCLWTLNRYTNIFCYAHLPASN